MNCYEEKIKMIDEYINQLDNAITQKDTKLIVELESEIIGTYDNEIKNIRAELDNYSGLYLMGGTPDYIGDAKKLKSKLNNFKINVMKQRDEFQKQASPFINFNQNIDNSNSVSINVSLEQALSQIDKISENVLSEEDKDLLSGKLLSLSKQKDKASKWEKGKNILKWIADKGVDVAIAVLPYILQSIQK